MSQLIKLLSIAVILFSLAASASWYLQYQKSAEPEEPQKTGAKNVKAPTKGSSTDSPPATTPLVRPPIGGDGDRLAQFSSSLQQQQELLKARENHLATREKQMDLIHVEIKKEQQKLDGVRKEIQAEFLLVQEKLELLEKKSAEMDSKRLQITRASEELDGKVTEIGGIEMANAKKLANIYEKMEPDLGAQGIGEMIDKGKLDMAVIILSNMSERQAAGLLGEVSKQDPGVAVQLIDRMRYYKTARGTPK